MADAPDSAIATSLRLTKALTLARQGKLKSAQQLLAGDYDMPANTMELHALAALVTHEGDNLRALRLWKLLQQRQPDHPEARRMIPMIELWMSRPAWHRWIPLGLIILATGVGCAILLWALSAFSAPEPTKPTSPSPASVAPAKPSAPTPVKPRPH